MRLPWRATLVTLSYESRNISMIERKSICLTNLLAGIALLFQLPIASESWAVSDPPERCAGYGDLKSISLTHWESGLSSWSASTHDIVDPATFDTPDWDVVGSLPDGRQGNAAFVANIDSGDCEADDESGALNLDSPSIVISDEATVPRVSVVHWVATEFLYDGGNFKISVNNGPFELIPSSAIEFGTYNETLASAEQFNTNPLASEDAFSGTDGAPYTSAWGESHINLYGIAGPGDTIRLRLDFGIDACDGVTGWYVDEVEVYSCTEELEPSDCGNGMIEQGEQCDDGNGFIGDGCSNTCQVDDGWACSTPIPPADVKDPSFEAGTPNPSWSEFSTNFGTPICGSDCSTGPGSGPLDGDYWALFGGTVAYEEGRLSQSVIIPNGVTALEFGVEVSACASVQDYLDVLVDGDRVLRIDGSSPLCGKLGYTNQTLDVSAYDDGAAHEIAFYSEVFGADSQRTYFFVDVVEMPGTASICTQATSTSLTLVKNVVNDNEGAASASDWTLSATGPSSFSGPGPSLSSGQGFEPGTYDLSESGGPAGYQASDWFCDGGTQNDADTITLAQDESATCTITNDDIPQASDINAGHAGAWFNPATSGQGQLIDIDPAAQFMFISWFTYTDSESDNPFEQRWLTAQGTYSGNTATLVLSETLGGQFNAPQAVTTSPIGEVTLTFSSCSEGSMSYTIDDEGLQGSFPLFRAVPGSEKTCQALNGQSTQAIDINAGMDGAWFDPLTSGQGFLFDSDPDGGFGDFLFVAWFTYGDTTASGQRWFTAQGNFEGSIADLTVNETTGGSFNDPQTPNTDPAGTMRIDFTDCSNAQLSYSLTEGNLEGDVAIQRAVPGAKALCEEIAGTD
ncbi:MAG: hypothetical protein KJN69_13335 [Gammaproteobacteria bacterium]|nr:hypothetical protein [Gammaproteobacteria bacterium]